MFIEWGNAPAKLRAGNDTVWLSRLGRSLSLPVDSNDSWLQD